MFDSKHPNARAWEHWTKEQTLQTADTLFGNVETWNECKEVTGNRAQCEMHFYFIERNEELLSHNELIYRSYDEIEKALTDAGFEIVSTWGYWDGSPLTDESNEMIFLARKR